VDWTRGNSDLGVPQASRQESATSGFMFQRTLWFPRSLCSCVYDMKERVFGCIAYIEFQANLHGSGYYNTRHL
jgi:hypothetical protein